MPKDIFNYIKKPHLNFYRKEVCIDKAYGMVTYPTSTLSSYIDIKKNLNTNRIRINDGIINYQNLVLMAKINYMEALKYHELSLQNDNEEDKTTYDFLARLLFEDVIVKLFSAYDRTYIILNDLFELKIVVEECNENFKKTVREEIRKKDKKNYKKINSIFSRLENTKAKKYRDDITHNRSIMLDRMTTDYKLKNGNVKFEEGLKINDAIKEIEVICNILEENKNLINELVKNKEKNYV